MGSTGQGACCVCIRCKRSSGTEAETGTSAGINEDVKAVAKDFRMIINEASPMLRTYLKKARLSAGEGNRLLIVLPDELSASAVATPKITKKRSSR